MITDEELKKIVGQAETYAQGDPAVIATLIQAKALKEVCLKINELSCKFEDIGNIMQNGKK